MRITFTIILIAVLSCLAAQTDRTNWTLVWEDEFDSLRTDIWLVKNNFDHWGGEPQVYTSRPENILIENGNLIIRLREEEYSCPPEYINQWWCARQYNTGLPYQYTSGWIETQPAYNTQYGRMEARILLPWGRGFWPAFWTFKADGVGVENAAEIDIFEMSGSSPSNRITTNVHLEYCNEEQPDYPVCANIPSYFRENIITNYAYSYHVYALEWTPSVLRFSYDDYTFRVMDNPGVVGPVRLILNMAIEPWSLPNENTPFPSDMMIDYVRVYSEATGVTENYDARIDVSLYPNPAIGRNEITIAIPADVEKILSVRIFDATGRAISEHLGIKGRQMNLDISGLGSGMFMAEVETSAGKAMASFIH